MDINGHLVKVIVDMVVFLEYTNPELLDEDVAIEAMEQLAAELKQMPDDDRRQLAKQIIGLSTSYEQPMRDFVKNLPDAIQLV